jgi:PAS domain S-box-containing protein
VPLEMLARSRATMAHLRSEIVAMEQIEDGLLVERAAVARRAQDRLIAVTVGGAAFGVAGGLLAAFVFTTAIARRIERLQTEAGRLAHGEPLSASDTAADEVGELARRLVEAGALMAQHLGRLEESRKELDSFFSLSLDLLCIADARGQFTRVNPAWEHTLGWSMAELTAVPFLDFVHGDDIAAAASETSRLGVGGTTVNFENRFRCKDGSYRWLNWKAAGIGDAGVIYAAARDVTEQKRVGQELQDRVTELAVVNQELEAFSYSVSHDLRAPLRHVVGFAALLRQHAGASLDEKGQRFVKTIADAAARMGQLIDDLLAFSRMGRAAMTTREVDLRDLVREVQRDVTSDINGRQIAWTVGALPSAEADPAMLRLVLTNLLSNAVKYTNTRERAEIEVGASADAGEVVVFVRDNGVGFEAQYVHKLFGVFQRLHTADEFEGTGIGLANVRRIIHRHGGRTWAEGAVDAGATFYFSLPVKGGTA